MLVIKKKQFDAFKVPVRKKNREKMLLELKSKGYHAQEGENRDLIISDGKGNKTRFVFNENYVAQKIVKPTGLEYVFEFDDNDNLTTFSFPGNEYLGFSYQKDLLKSISLNKERIWLNYDEKSRLTEVITPDQKKNRITYNISNQVETVTNRANETKTFATAIKDNRLLYTLKDSLGRATQIDTDPMGSGDKITFPDGTSETTVYDEDLDAYVTTLRDGAKRVTYYDDINPRGVEWSGGNYLNLELNDKQQVKALDNPAGTITYEYDDKECIICEGFQGNKVFYAYDADGLLTEMVYPSGLVVKYIYDEDGRLKEINAGGKNICTYKYGANDTVAEVIYPNGLTEIRRQQVLGGLNESRLETNTGSLLSKQTYQYDKLSRLINYRSSDKIRPQKDKNWVLAYDDEDRLVSNVETQSGKAERFSYDNKGNISSANGDKIRMGAMDEIVSIADQSVSYDGNGNVSRFVNREGRIVELTFNPNKELQSARVNDHTWEYWYDGLGRRVGKSNGKDAYKFFWGSEKLLTEEVKTVSGTTLRQYVYGYNSAVPVAFIEDNKTYWLYADARGAVTHVFDVNGVVVWCADYTSFGEAIVYVNNIRQPFRLTGQYLDSETGLHYSTARYYSPVLHQFISLDPKWLQHGATNYSYAINDPYNKIDVDGNLADWVAAGIGLATSIAVGAAVAATAPAWAAGAAGVLAFMAIGAIAGALGDGIASVVENVAKGEEVCVPCALKAAGMGALFGAIGGPIGKLLGKALRPVARIAKAKIVKTFPWAKNSLRVSLRKAKAEKFYSNAGFDKKSARAHMKGIDFNKPVKVVKIPPENQGVLHQFQKRNVEGKLGSGEYFTTDPKATPSQLGISDKYNRRYNPSTKKTETVSEVTMVEKVEIKLSSEKPVTGLKSTTKKINDTWNIDGQSVSTEGGATQVCIPRSDPNFTTNFQ